MIILILKFLNRSIGRIYKKKIIFILLTILCLVMYAVINFHMEKDNELSVKPLPMFGINFNSVSRHMETNTANDLYQKVRILCAILVRVDTFHLYFLQKTWVKHCNKVCYLSGNLVGGWEVVRLQMANYIDGVIRPTLDYLVNDYDLNDIDWVLIVESNT